MFIACHTRRSGSQWSGALASTERRSQIFDVRQDPHRFQQTEDSDSIMEVGVGVDRILTCC